MRNKLLNAQQKEAIETICGPLLVVAGAGSGKTTCLIERTNHMVEKGVSPNEILLLTFTNKAVDEIKERLKEEGVSNVSTHTFHSFCLQVLSNELPNKFRLISDIERSKLIYTFSKGQRLTPNEIKTIEKNILFYKNEINYPNIVKNEKILNFIDWNKIESQEKNMELTKETKFVFSNYQTYLEKEQLMDLDDLIFKTILLFSEHPEILEKYQDMYRYISVDEFQDTNHIQYVLIKQLASKYKNIAVVGDDFQSIYGFRNADIRNILSFENDFASTKVVKLEANYRSTNIIVEASNELIKKNENQMDKTLVSEKESKEKITFLSGNSFESEAKQVVKHIKKIMVKTELDKIAVLYRYHHYSNALQEVLESENIPFSIVQDDQYDETISTENSIKLLTAHSAKGLEFDCVFVIGCSEGTFPGYHAVNNNELLEEERRLFYVAMTRAKEKLYLSYAINHKVNKKDGSFFIKEMKPSRFLSEFKKKYRELK